MHPGNAAMEQRFKELRQLTTVNKKRGHDRKLTRKEIRRADLASIRRMPARRFRFRGAGMEDIFSDLFGGARGAGGGRLSNRRRCAPVRIDLAAVKGVRRQISRHDGKSLNVNIPAGTEDGQTLRLKGQGLQGKNGGVAGDAYVEVLVDPHPFFKREKSDIELELPISIDEAILGAKIKVPTVNGPVTVTVPPYSSSGTRLRLDVFAPHGGNAGDQYVH